MTDYTPTTEQVRGQYTREQPPPIATMGEKRAEFDRWLDEIRAEAWDAAVDDAYRVASATAARTQSIDAILAALTPQRKEIKDAIGQDR